LVIPAFSVGRTQSIVFTLNQLHQKGLLPAIKVYVDSPLAIKSTNIYASYLEMLNEEARDFYKKHGDLFEFPQLELIENDMESRALRDVFEPAIIVSAAGMVEGGRIQEHIRNHIQNPYATILIAGFCAPGTLGHRLLMGQSTISIKNREFPVYATVTNTDVFSSHGDHDTLVDIITKTNNQHALKQVFLVHGEPSGMDALKADLGEVKERTLFPAKGDSFTL
jgi:metallo-beta-lactamase family protein